jgi:hypothetical protein
MEENLGAATIELTPDDVRVLKNASSKIKLEGARIPRVSREAGGSLNDEHMVESGTRQDCRDR